MQSHCSEVTDTLELFSDSDTDYQLVQCEDERQKKCRKKAIASPCISNNSKRFGGIKTMTRLYASVETSPVKSRSQKKGKQMLSTLKSPKRQRLDISEVQDGSNSTSHMNEHTPLTEENRKDLHHIPYYLVNFENVIRGVIDETEDKSLFLPDEIETLELFRSLEVNARKLYVRLFQRKWSWILLQQISYDEVFGIDRALKTLVKEGFLHEGKQIEELEVLLELLHLPQLRKICKQLNIVPKKGTSQKKDFVQALLNHSKQKSFKSFFAPACGKGEDLRGVVISK